jgi:hypothetical protein
VLRAVGCNVVLVGQIDQPPSVQHRSVE